MARDGAPRGWLFYWVWVPVVVPALGFVGREAYSAWLAPRMPWAAPAAGPVPMAAPPPGPPQPDTPDQVVAPARPAPAPHVLDD